MVVTSIVGGEGGLFGVRKAFRDNGNEFGWNADRHHDASSSSKSSLFFDYYAYGFKLPNVC